MVNAALDEERTGEWEIGAEAVGIVISRGERGDEPARFAAYEWFLPEDGEPDAA